MDVLTLKAGEWLFTHKDEGAPYGTCKQDRFIIDSMQEMFPHGVSVDREGTPDQKDATGEYMDSLSKDKIMQAWLHDKLPACAERYKDATSGACAVEWMDVWHTERGEFVGFCETGGLIQAAQLRDIVHAYGVAALWASVDEDGKPLDNGRDQSDIEDETLLAMVSDCIDFINLAAKSPMDDSHSVLESYIESCDRRVGAFEEQLGHDFWLTRHGHGTGFWDRGLGAVGTKMSNLAKTYGSFDLYVNPEGRVAADGVAKKKKPAEEPKKTDHGHARNSRRNGGGQSRRV